MVAIIRHPDPDDREWADVNSVAMAKAFCEATGRMRKKESSFAFYNRLRETIKRAMLSAQLAERDSIRGRLKQKSLDKAETLSSKGYNGAPIMLRDTEIQAIIDGTEDKDNM